MKNHVELLAPAGSPEALRAAVLCGADAVYLGTHTINARQNATNFDDAQLFEAVRFCHVRGVKVYQTLNTLLFDQEFSDLERAVKTACEAGVDAIIVQDFGVAAAIHQMAPKMKLHASTQMSIYNLAGVQYAHSIGFSRVVLARELTEGEIGTICAQSPVEIELFVHGALCMSVSGQCLLSSMVGERSGNRGLCAQPCRLPFSVKGGKNPAALSLKDLSLVEEIDRLREIGVSSLKIEGRMKRPEYVAAAVTACRQALEGQAPDLDALRAIFSRTGFTDGYFAGSFDAQMFGVRQKEDVLSAKTVLDTLAQRFHKETPRVPVDLQMTIRENQPVTLKAQDADGHAITATGEIPERAVNRATDAESVRQALAKTGGTAYFAREMQVDLDEGLNLPVSAIKGLRRDCLTALDEQRGAVAPSVISALETPMGNSLSETTSQQKMGLRARLKHAKQLSKELIELAQYLILPPGEALVALTQYHTIADKLMVALPRLVFGSEQVETQLKLQLAQLKEQGVTHALLPNVGLIALAKEFGFTMHGSFALNLLNSLSLSAMHKAGFADVELSLECSMQRARRLVSPLSVGLVAYGALPLMLLRNCPVKANMGCAACKGKYEVLTDRTGSQFPIECGQEYGYVEMLNSRLLYLADRKQELAFFDHLVLWFTSESPEECLKITQEYAKGEGSMPGATRGLYYRQIQ